MKFASTRAVEHGADSHLGYSDGVNPQQQRVLILTAQEFVVGRLLLDEGILKEEWRQRRCWLMGVKGCERKK